jgi:rhodanese-related sulfurtransferase
MKKFLLNMALIFGMLASGQTQKPSTGNTAFDAELDGLLSSTIPLLSVDDLKRQLDKFKIYDAREIHEYTISHLPNAIHAGYDQFDHSIFEGVKKDEPILLYCSVGYRSEKIGEKLQKMGFTKVYNLYGSIFEWVNKGYPVENSSNKNAKEVHTYDEKWSQWVTNPNIKKIW